MDLSSASDKVIQVQDLSKTYQDGLFRRRQVEALRGVSFSVSAGEIFGLIGPNGAGKTTLIKILLGIVHKTAGTAMLLGHTAGHRRSREHVGYLPEGHRIPPHLTGNTALEYYGQLSNMPMSQIRKRRPLLLKQMGLSKAAGRSVKGYSKGMLQRLGLAQALMHDPDLLFLDEPTDGVDPRGRAEIRDLLLELKSEGKSIFVNSHQLQELELLCDQVVMLEKGEVKFQGSLEDATGQKDEVNFTLAGNRQKIEEALAPSNHSSLTPLQESQFRVTVEITSQAEVDRLIDALRAKQISVVSLSRSKRSLEEAFLDFIPDTDDE